MIDMGLPRGLQRITVATPERQRTALLFTPTRLTQPESYVFCFHGAGSNADAMVEFCGMHELAEEAGFGVVYPNGSGRSEDAGTWNGGPHCGYAGRHNIDDVGFTRILLERLSGVREAALHQQRFFATGMSNGGLMCYRLAEELSEWFPAIAPVAGAMAKDQCQPTRPVSVLHIHGTDDEFVPYHGGIGRRSLTKTPFVSVNQSVQAWVAANQCDPTPIESRLPRSVQDGTAAIRFDYVGGLEMSRVSLIQVQGGGHTWPGHPSAMDFLGKTSLNLDANELIWQFFSTSSGGNVP